MQPLKTTVSPSSASTIGCGAALGQVDDRQPAVAEGDRARRPDAAPSGPRGAIVAAIALDGGDVGTLTGPVLSGESAHPRQLPAIAPYVAYPWRHDGADQEARRPSTAATPPASSRRAGAPAAEPTADERKPTAKEAWAQRWEQPPTWRSAANRAAFAAVLFGVLVLLIMGRTIAQAVVIAVAMLVLYIPLGYYTDPRSTSVASVEPRARSRDGRPHAHRRAGAGELLPRAAATDAATARASSTRATRPPRLLAAIESSASTVEAILLTHTHFDHVGAVAPVARATGAPVYCPRARGRRARGHHELRPVPGLRAVRVLRGRADASPAASGSSSPASRSTCIFTPGHSPGHVTYSIARRAKALFSGDVLFQGSIGRTDLPGGDHATLLRVDRAGCSTRCPTRPSVLPGPHGHHDARRRARDATRSSPSSPAARRMSAEDPGPARHVRRAARRGARARAALEATARADPRARRLRRASRRRRSRRPSCSRAASASRPTSCRRRCTRSRTAAGGR